MTKRKPKVDKTSTPKRQRKARTHTDIFSPDQEEESELLEADPDSKQKLNDSSSSIVAYPIQVYMKNLDLHDMDLCVLCGSAGDSKDLMFCMECGDCYHSFCLNLPLTIPESNKRVWR